MEKHDHVTDLLTIIIRQDVPHENIFNPMGRFVFGLWVSAEEITHNNKQLFLYLRFSSELTIVSSVSFILLEHLSPSIHTWGIQDSTFTTAGLEKSHMPQNEL